MTTADVVVEAFRPGVADRLGIGPAALRALNPRLVHAQISAFGQTGPEHLRPAHDLGIEAMAGVVSLDLGHDGKPTHPHMPVADIAGSMLALTAILMTLLRRGTTGQGDAIDISMQDATMNWLPNVIGPVFAENRAPVVKEERNFGGFAFYNIYETADAKLISLAGVEHKFVHNLLNALDLSQHIKTACGPPGPGQTPVKQALAAVFWTRTRAEWVAWFAGKDICFAPVLDLHEAWHQPQVTARGMLLRDEQGNLHIGNPIRFADEPGQPDLRVPDLDEHGRAIRADLWRG